MFMAPCRIVIPHMDDCVYLLLQRGDAYAPNLKEMEHLYLYEKHVSESLLSRIAQLRLPNPSTGQ